MPQRKEHLRYAVYFERLEDGNYQVFFPSLPEIVTFGATLEEAREMAMDALLCHLEGLEKDGQPLPEEEFRDFDGHREVLELSFPSSAR